MRCRSRASRSKTASRRALGVVADGDGFAWGAGRAAPELTAAVRSIELALQRALPNGYRSEVCLTLPAWFRALGAALERGSLLFVDYGLVRSDYYHEQRAEGTLVCHYRHRAHDDPFAYPGLQDITAWVDFSACADAASAAGFDVAGFTTQGHYLLSVLAALPPELAADSEVAARAERDEDPDPARRDGRALQGLAVAEKRARSRVARQGLPPSAVEGRAGSQNESRRLGKIVVLIRWSALHALSPVLELAARRHRGPRRGRGRSRAIDAGQRRRGSRLDARPRSPGRRERRAQRARHLVHRRRPAHLADVLGGPELVSRRRRRHRGRRAVDRRRSSVRRASASRSKRSNGATRACSRRRISAASVYFDRDRWRIGFGYEQRDIEIPFTLTGPFGGTLRGEVDVPADGISLERAA